MRGYRDARHHDGRVAIGLGLPCFLLLVTRLKSIHAMSTAALMVLVGLGFVLGERFLDRTFNEETSH